MAKLSAGARELMQRFALTDAPIIHTLPNTFTVDGERTAPQLIHELTAAGALIADGNDTLFVGLAAQVLRFNHRRVISL